MNLSCVSFQTTATIVYNWWYIEKIKEVPGKALEQSVLESSTTMARMQLTHTKLQGLWSTKKSTWPWIAFWKPKPRSGTEDLKWRKLFSFYPRASNLPK